VSRPTSVLQSAERVPKESKESKVRAVIGAVIRAVVEKKDFIVEQARDHGGDRSQRGEDALFG